MSPLETEFTIWLTDIPSLGSGAPYEVFRHFDTAAHRQLRMLALEQSRSVQDLMTEATNDLFQKHEKARIAD